MGTKGANYGITFLRMVTVPGMVTILCIITFLEMVNVLWIATILGMVTILEIVTSSMDGGHRKGW